MGSSSSGSARRAQAAEDKRRADIEQTQSRIEGIFGSDQREGDIQSFIDSTRGYLQKDLNREKTTNDRELKFALARSGLQGSSTSVDQNRLMSEAFLRATVEGERRAQSAGQGLRAADQESKLNLFNQALGGLDMTLATNNSLESMRNNIDFAKNINSENNFDSFFSDFGNLFTASRKAAGERRESVEFGSNNIYAQPINRATAVAGGS